MQQDDASGKRSIKDLIDADGHPLFFTPLDASRNKRLEFKRSDVVLLSGSLDKSEYGKLARVRIDGVIYDVYGLDCGLESCVCDAYIVPVREGVAL